MGADKNPWRSVVFAGVITLVIAAFADLTLSVAISSFGTLLYYSITNVSALRLQANQRTFPRILAVAGVVGCLGLAFSLAQQYVVIGLAILAAGLVFRLLISKNSESARHQRGVSVSYLCFFGSRILSKSFISSS